MYTQFYLTPFSPDDDDACSFGYSRDEQCNIHRPSHATKPAPTKPAAPEPSSKPTPDPSPEPSPTRKLVCCRALPELLEPRSHVTGVPMLRDDAPVVNDCMLAGSHPSTTRPAHYMLRPVPASSRNVSRNVQGGYKENRNMCVNTVYLSGEAAYGPEY